MRKETLGTLSDNDEKNIQKNIAQLALIHGNMMFASAKSAKSTKSVYVTSCHVGEGKTTVAIQIAHGLAINRCNVLLVDANPRNPSIHTKYQLVEDAGFLDAATSQSTDYTQYIVKTKYPNLHIMSFGVKKTDRPDLINLNILNIIKQLTSNFDYVILDGHAVTGSDTVMVAGCCDSSVIVVECEATKWEVIKQAQEKLTIMRSSVLGVVLNKRNYYIPKFLY